MCNIRYHEKEEKSDCWDEHRNLNATLYFYIKTLFSKGKHKIIIMWSVSIKNWLPVELSYNIVEILNVVNCFLKYANFTDTLSTLKKLF